MHFVTALLFGLLTFLGEALTRWLVSLGATFVVYHGVELMISQFISQMQSFWSGIPSHIVQILGIAGINEAMSIVVSCVVFHLTMSFVNKKILAFRGGSA